jgi:DNA-binding Lrp family transcriptional regulator
MDKIDKIILSDISENCRKSMSEIGKSIRKSPQFTRYRVENLKQKAIHIIPIIFDFYSLGYTEVTGLVKFKFIEPLSEKILIDELFKKTETYKLAYTSGNYSLLVSFIVKDLDHAQIIKEELMAKFNIEMDLLVNYETRLFALNYLSEKYSEKDIILNKKEIKEEKVFPEFLMELQKNPLSSTLEISGKIDSSYDKCIYYIKNSNLLLGNSMILSHRIVERAFVLLNLKSKKSFDSLCKGLKNVTEVNYFIGNYDALITVESTEKINQIVKSVVYSLKDHINEYDILNINRFYKYGWYGLY